MAGNSERASAPPSSGAAAKRSRKPVAKGRPKRVTLREVARRAGVSPTAASFVLSDRDDQRISEQTKQRVRKAARELQYRPDLTARGLRTGTSGTIALVSEFLSTTAYAGAAVRGALEAARRHGALLYIAETLGDPQVEQQLLQGMLDRRVDGFVYAAMFTHTVVVPQALRDVPLVLLNCISSDVKAPMVIPDEVGAGAAAARALLDAGHRDAIYFVGTLPPGVRSTPGWEGREAWALTERLKGIRAELKGARVALAGTATVTDWEPRDGRDAVSALLRDGAVPKAVICVNDRVAMGAYQALATAGLQIPRDVSVISFDDSDIAGWLQPMLSSVALPHAELGRTAIELLLAGTPRSGRQRVPMSLVERESVGPPRPS